MSVNPSDMKITGYIDGIVGGDVMGWATDENDPAGTLSLQIHLDGENVGEIRADLPRADLVATGAANGNVGFAARIPARFLDGGEHRIEVRESRSGTALKSGADAFLLADFREEVDVALDEPGGAIVAGTIRHPALARRSMLVSLHENDTLLVEADSEPTVDPHRHGFALRLPASVCDGRPHGFGIALDGRRVDALAMITPFHTTPDVVLADYAGEGLRAQLSNIAAWRYRALAEQIADAVDGGTSTLPDIDTAHRFLVAGAAHAGLDETYKGFSLPDVAEPEVSIVIPVHDQFDYSYRCLASLRLMPNARSFEVIVVDDGSSDRTRDLESLVGGIRVIRNAAPLGFVHACNAGAAAARGRHVVLLNNDTEVSPHWLDRLIEPFELYDDVGMVGAKLLFADGRLQEAGGIVWRDGRADNFGRGGNARDPRYNFLRETDYCSGACLAVDKALWDEMGGFDPAYAPAYYEDTDLAFRMRQRGRRVLYQPLSEVLHFEGTSNGVDLASGTKRHQAINQPIFLERWAADMRHHGLPDGDVGLAAERSYPRRVLVIDTEVPQPDRSAGHHAAVQEMRLLQSLGYRPTFLPQNMAYLARYNDLLASLGVEAVHAPFYLDAEDFLARRGQEFDLVYITRYAVAERMLPLIERHCPRAKTVFNNADLHFLRAIRETIESADPALRSEALAVRERELAVIRSVDLTLSYSDVEHAVIQSHTLGEAPVAKCPWVVEPRGGVPAFEDRRDIVFLGGYRHPPNVRAVEYFVAEVMPLLRKARPGVRLRVYGSYPPVHLADLAAEDVVIEGFVDRVETALDGARLFVAPLLTGAGIKGKVLEALASGVPSILSPIAAEGIGLREGLETVIATSPAQWVEAIDALYDDRARWDAMAAAGRAFVEANHSFERARAVLKQSFAEHGITTLTGMVSRRLPDISRS